MLIFRGFRRLVEAIEALVNCLRDLASIQREAGPALERLDTLELSRHRFEAQVEGILLKAEGKLKAASNAEARERQLKRSYESHLLDPIVSDSQEGTEEGRVLPVDVAGSQEEGMQPLRVGLAPNSKAHAVRAKWYR